MKKTTVNKMSAGKRSTVGPRVRLNHDLLLDDYNKLRVIASIRHESVPRLLVRMAEDWHAKRQMLVVTLPVSVVSDAYYIARHLGFENHEKWIEQSLSDSIRAASKQFRDNGINLRRALISAPKEEHNGWSEKQKGSQARNRATERELQEFEDAPGQDQ